MASSKRASTHFSRLKIGGENYQEATNGDVSPDSVAASPILAVSASLSVVGNNAPSRTTTVKLPVGATITNIWYHITTALSPSATRVNVGTAADSDAYGASGTNATSYVPQGRSLAQVTAGSDIQDSDVVVSVTGTPTAGVASVRIEYIIP